jgi:hypothetical protein
MHMPILFYPAPGDPAAFKRYHQVDDLAGAPQA